MTFPRAARLMLALLLVGLAGAAGSAARSGADRPEQTWTEISWPFLLDEWGAGQAFRCEDKACGLEARLFVREGMEWMTNVRSRSTCFTSERSVCSNSS